MGAWQLSHRFDVAARRIADRHYNRQTVGSPQFSPPGRLLVLTTPEALWVTNWQEYADHAWPGAWVNTIFRNEGGALSSLLISEAIAITRWKWGHPADHGLITFVDPGKVRSKRDPGRCFRRVGFEVAGETQGGLLALLLCSARLPYFGVAEPRGAQLALGLAS